MMLIQNTKHLWQLLATISLISVTACTSESAGDNGDAPAIERDWQEMADGSFFEKHNRWEISEDMIASRCWPIGAGYDCVVMSYDPSGLLSPDMERQVHRDLGDFDMLDTGYECSSTATGMFGIVYQEAIRNDEGEVLLENAKVERPPYQDGWSADFALQFMRENGVSRENSFFRCQAFIEMLDAGSPATLGTTAVSHSDFLPEAPAP